MSESLVEALSNAAKTNDVSSLKKLLADPRSKQIIRNDHEDNSPLIQAISNLANEATILLLKAKANPNQKGFRQYTALQIATMVNCEFHIMERLLEAKANPNCKTLTPLHEQLALPASTTPIEKVKLLLKHKADIKFVANAKGSALHFLASHPSPNFNALLDLLITVKADVNNQNDEGRTPLSLVITNRGSAPHLHALLSKNANPMLKGAHGELAIDDALESENLAAIKVLAEAKNCDLNEPGRHGRPALHRSIFCSFQCTTMLLRTGKVDINKKNEEGDTPLHIAINKTLSRPADESYPYAALVQTLLAYKANLNVTDKLGRTPLALLPKAADSSKTQLLVRDILLTKMRKQALLAGLLPRTGARSPVRLASFRPIFDRQVYRPIWASAFGPGRHKDLQNKTPEQKVLLQTLQRLAIDLPLTLLCSESISLPFSLIYSTSAEATAVCARLKNLLGTDPVKDPVSLKVEESNQGWVFSISQQQYEKLLTLDPGATSILGR